MNGQPVATVESVLRDLAAEGATGCLTVLDQAAEAADVFMRDGRITSIALPGRRPAVGRKLVAAGHLKADALAEALEIQRTELAGWRLGELLVHLGYVDRPLVVTYVLDQLRDSMMEVLDWPTVAWRWRAGRKTRLDVAPPRLFETLFDEVSDRRLPWDVIRAEIGGPDAVPHRTDLDPPSDADGGPDAQAALSAVDGVRTVLEIGRACNLRLYQCGKTLYGLVEAGRLVVVPADVGHPATRGAEGPEPSQEQAQLIAQAAAAADRVRQEAEEREHDAASAHENRIADKRARIAAARARVAAEQSRAEADKARAEEAAERALVSVQQARAEAEQARMDAEQARVDAAQAESDAERARVEAEQARIAAAEREAVEAEARRQEEVDAAARREAERAAQAAAARLEAERRRREQIEAELEAEAVKRAEAAARRAEEQRAGELERSRSGQAAPVVPEQRRDVDLSQLEAVRVDHERIRTARAELERAAEERAAAARAEADRRETERFEQSFSTGRHSRPLPADEPARRTEDVDPHEPIPALPGAWASDRATITLLLEQLQKGDAEVWAAIPLDEAEPAPAPAGPDEAAGPGQGELVGAVPPRAEAPSPAAAAASAPSDTRQLTDTAAVLRELSSLGSEQVRDVDPTPLPPRRPARAPQPPPARKRKGIFGR